MTHVRLAYRVFQMFYDITTTSTKQKTQEDFIRSQYYEAFTKFGRSCVRNEYLDPIRFSEWLIRNGKRLSDWSKDRVYDEYLLDYVKREPGMKAMERTILYLSEWAEETSNDWQEYFVKVSVNRAVYDIRSAKISPWLLYLSNTGEKLLTRMNDEHIKMVDHIIDAAFWMDVFKQNQSEMQEVQSMCEQAGI